MSQKNFFEYNVPFTNTKLIVLTDRPVKEVKQEIYDNIYSWYDKHEKDADKSISFRKRQIQAKKNGESPIPFIVKYLTNKYPDIEVNLLLRSID